MTRPFTTEDFARCIERAEQQAVQARLTGVLVASGRFGVSIGRLSSRPRTAAGA
jgi:hypothetical protein